MRCLPTLLFLVLTTGIPRAHEVDPIDTLAVLRHAFEDNDCIMTKNQILRAFQDVGYDPTQATAAAADATRRDDVDRLYGQPPTYRYSGSPRCAF